MTDVIIVENFFLKIKQKTLENKILLDEELNWHYVHNYVFQDKTMIQKSTDKDVDILKHNHGTLISPLILPGIDKLREFGLENILLNIQEKFNIKIQSILRMQFNLILPLGIETKQYSYPHIDHYLDKAKTFLYYINDTDGDTVIFKERVRENNLERNFDKKTVIERIEPKAGRAILFDAQQYHANSFPSKKPRAVLVATFLTP